MPARAHAAIASARVDVVAPRSLGDNAVAALRARGITARVVETPGDDDVVAWALPAPPSAAVAVELAHRSARAAEAGRPICLLVPAVRGSGRAAIERAAALAHLRAHGAAITHDVDAWLEAVVLLVRFGLPRGPRIGVSAPAGSWLEAQATAIVVEIEGHGARSPLTPSDELTDVVLYDPSLETPPARSLAGGAEAIPVVPRAELAADTVALHGARAALGAVTMLGRAAERIAVGLGPAPRTASAELAIDRGLLDRRLAELGKLGMLGVTRIGDHETKALLRAYGVEITKQVVASTPSAAVKRAHDVAEAAGGFPVEMKPFGHDLPSEPDGCPVERGLGSDALIRQAYGAITAKAKTETVIVRETPPAGREVHVSFLEIPSLGWTVVLDAPGSQLAAAPAPLRLIDAQTLANHVIASRAGDPEPDRAGLANVLRRASHLVADVDAIATLELSRVIVGGRAPVRTLVVDAAATLR